MHEIKDEFEVFGTGVNGDGTLAGGGVGTVRIGELVSKEGTDNISASQRPHIGS